MPASAIKLYNTLSGSLETLSPIQPGKVGMYICGVTVYDKCHLGHIRSAVNYDVIRGFIEFAGYRVKFVKNFTDIDDKIINRANESGIHWQTLTEKLMRQHDETMAAFGIRLPDIAPKATEHIPEMIKVIESLLHKGYAYQSGGDVYFRVEKFEKYGQLSGKIQSELNAGHRVEQSELKQNQYDFALWKNSKPGEPHWESPWGNGRPGWHIECSAMCTKYLDDTFDIHGGGSDLIFPHHENEIAQSYCHTGKIPAKYWLHNEMVTVDGRKMSKSLGNFITADDLTQTFHPEIIRLYLLKTHYRQILNYTRSALQESADNLDRLYNTLKQFKFSSAIVDELNQTPVGTQNASIEKHDEFTMAMCDDFNTPAAFAAMFNMSRKLNGMSQDDRDLEPLLTHYIRCGHLLGIFRTNPEAWFKNKRIDMSKTPATLSVPEIEMLIKQRNQARKEKNWRKADEIRNQLKHNNITIQDKGEETIWHFQ